MKRTPGRYDGGVDRDRAPVPGTREPRDSRRGRVSLEDERRRRAGRRYAASLGAHSLDDETAAEVQLWVMAGYRGQAIRDFLDLKGF